MPNTGPPRSAAASSPSPTGPPIASGLWKPLPEPESSRGWPNAVPRADSTTIAAPAHSTGRQRRDGSCPSGNSSGSRMPTSPNQRKMTHWSNHTSRRIVRLASAASSCGA